MTIFLLIYDTYAALIFPFLAETFGIFLLSVNISSPYPLPTKNRLVAKELENGKYSLVLFFLSANPL